MTIALALLMMQEVEFVDRNSRCMECHEKSVDEWKASVHATEKTGCIECHGVDALRPLAQRNKHVRTAAFKPARDRKRTAEFCGSCHTAEMEDFVKSAHSKATLDANMSGCLACHGHHETPRAEAAVIMSGEACQKCHPQGTREYVDGQLYVQRMGTLQSSMRRMARRLNEPRRIGVSRLEAGGAMSAAGRVLDCARIAQHGLDFSEKAAGESAAKLDEAYNNLDRQERNFAGRFVWLAVFLALVAGNAALVKIKAARYGKGAS